jgi:hypothetical protein
LWLPLLGLAGVASIRDTKRSASYADLLSGAQVWSFSLKVLASRRALARRCPTMEKFWLGWCGSHRTPSRGGGVVPPPFGFTLEEEAVADCGSSARLRCISGEVDLVVSHSGAVGDLHGGGCSMPRSGIIGHGVSQPSPVSSLGGGSLGGYGRALIRVVGAVVFEVRRRWLAGGTIVVMTPRRWLGGGTSARRLGGCEVSD